MTTDNSDIDTEALQAQIDMSMAIVHDMVSSWIKPSHNTPSRVTKDVDEELREYMRRPPRLGVGAAIPESGGPTRETARLRGRLVDKAAHKRAREEAGHATTIEKVDDNEESRAGAIKKKARIDPFSEGKGKKKNKTISLLAVSNSNAPAGSRKENYAEDADGKVGQEIDEDKAPPLQSTEPQINTSQAVENRIITPNVSSPSPSLNHSPVHGNDIINSTTRRGSTGVDAKEDDAASNAHPGTSQAKALDLQLPLLNLGGPVPGLGLHGNDESPATGERKKKKKRRKKRKIDTPALQGS